MFRFDGRVLVVDDVQTNLDVARGLMLPYRLRIEGVKSGQEAMERVAEAERQPAAERYDIIFMDHMMPGMDGVEATKQIRERGSEYARRVPIVALTANAVVGTKEMFLENGIDDFLAKPIDIKKLDSLLRRWIPREKQAQQRVRAGGNVEPGAIPEIAGLEVAGVLNRTGFTVSTYKDLLSVFYRDAGERVEQIEDYEKRGDIRNYTIVVHALKSALQNIGGMELGVMAAQLEAAGKAGNREVISKKTGEFVEVLEQVRSEIGERLGLTQGGGEKKGGLSDLKLEELRAALVEMDTESITTQLMEYKKANIAGAAWEFIQKIEQYVLLFEYEKAVEEIDQSSGNTGI
ncbi:hypothetical protein FACS1894164_20680 [Spirochaetia bacterium]|nr:hypothetical protein FACS1894164_20680 [Spirochaetia bacterium]